MAFWNQKQKYSNELTLKYDTSVGLKNMNRTTTVRRRILKGCPDKNIRLMIKRPGSTELRDPVATSSPI